MVRADMLSDDDPVLHAEPLPETLAEKVERLVVCLGPELTLQVQRGVREELRRFFGAGPAEIAGAATPPVTHPSWGAASVEAPATLSPPGADCNRSPRTSSEKKGILKQEFSPLKVVDSNSLTPIFPAPMLPPLDMSETGTASMSRQNRRGGSDQHVQFCKADTASLPEECQAIGTGTGTSSLSADGSATARKLVGVVKSDISHLMHSEMTPLQTCQTSGEAEDGSAFLLTRHYRAYSVAAELGVLAKQKQAEDDIKNLTRRDTIRSLFPGWNVSEGSNHSGLTGGSARGSLAEKTFECLALIVTHAAFDSVIGVVIILNAMSIGFQTDYVARHVNEDELPLTFSLIEWCFATIFTLELLARLVVFGRTFFTMPGRNWNVFDCVVVGLQLVELCFLVVSGSKGFNVSAFRVLRFLRLVRVVRLARIMRLFGELRTIVVSIIGSMRSLGWTVLLLLLMIYMIAVYLTQLVSDWRREQGTDLDQMSTTGIELEYYYGSVPRSILSLYQSISGGVSWDLACAPLMSNISPIAGVLFALYIAFAVLAIMNVVTGVFVESALATAKDDKDVVLLNNVREAFTRSDVDGSGSVTWQEFQEQLGLQEMQEVFRSINIDTAEASTLFQLLDIEETGNISLCDFYDGCMRIRGAAKAIDMVTVLYESRRSTQRIVRLLKKTSDAVEEIAGILKVPGSRFGSSRPGSDIDHVKSAPSFLS